MHIVTAFLVRLSGWLFLWVRYRDGEKVAQALEEEYENDYYNAGMILFLNIIVLLFLAGILGLLAAGVYSIFRGER